jgi:Zn-dependent metalloprotease
LNQGAKDSDWLIGSTCMHGDGYALRSMKSPGKAYQNHPVLGNDPQPGHMSDYMELPNTRQGDYGGVHINSGIPNHAFYLAAYNLGGNSWDKAGKIWYEALCDASLMHAHSQFTDLRNGTISKAELLFGVGSNEAKTVTKAWMDVGL